MLPIQLSRTRRSNYNGGDSGTFHCGTPKANGAFSIIGKSISQYLIIEKLGSGGMGDVYRARDPQLKRDVALKILPPDLALDPDRLARFEREAQVLASLNHPHIAQVHGIVQNGGERAIVMELVEGPTLAERLARGPVPLDEALRLGRQLAEALEYAHERGIIHRDLKPANIKLTNDGEVKVLDFGLAKALVPEAAAVSSGGDALPTLGSLGVTRAGVILGTAAYMSPEQARGGTVDRRADIWAFGAVLFETLTGQACFAGDTVTDVLAAVMRADPDWAKIPADVPPRLRGLMRRCLAKDRKQRLQAIGDVRIELEDIAATPVGAADASVAVPRARWPFLVGALSVTALAAVLAIVLSGLWPRPRAGSQRPLRVSIIHTEGNEVGAPAISPDGRRIAYRARRADGMPMLWVRDLEDTFDAKPLSGTEDAYFPFWSPDSRQLGFAQGEFLKRIPADGGPVQNIIAAAAVFGATWAPNDTIVFGLGDFGLRRVRVIFGTTAPSTTSVTKLLAKDWSHLWPSFLPDGRRFLFTAKCWTSSAEASEQGIYLGTLDSPEKIRRLLPDLSSAVCAPPGYIVFARDGMLMAAPFNLETESLGEPKPLGLAVATDSTYYLNAASVADDGTLAVRPPPALAVGEDWGSGTTTELRLMDRTGRFTNTLAPDRYNRYVALAPDSLRAAVGISDPRGGTTDLWMVQMQTGARTPLTASRGFAGAPVWSKDGERLAYAYQPPGQLDDVYVKDLRKGKDMPITQTPDVWEHPVAWSSDGTFLLVDRIVGDDYTSRGIFVWSLASRTLTPFIKSSGAWEAVFSPDDRYVAFSSRESGHTEVYVTTFPERRQTWPLTTEGARVLSWSKDGREILVATLSGHIAAYPVSTEGGFTAGKPTILLRDIGITAPYSSANADHSRILIRVNPESTKDKGEIRLLFGWAEQLRAK